MALPKVSQEPIIYVDATPDEDYPLRILRAYRENCNCEWVSDTDNPMVDQMNKDCRKRAVILDAAILMLCEKRGEPTPVCDGCGKEGVIGLCENCRKG